MRKILPLTVIVIALALLLPGITQPVLTLEGRIDKSQLAQVGIEMLAEEGDVSTRNMLMMASSILGLDKLEGEISAYQKTRSIWGTVNELADNKNYLVAVLVAFFSIVIPTLKLLMQLLYMFLPVNKFKHMLGRVIQGVTKWSMVDVFVIALIVAYLAGNADGQMGELINMHAQLGAGFWYFTGYCLFAIAASSLIKVTPRNS
ncbi:MULTISPECIES: paraquat-inducible protein A [unclassified Pseudoalteromonas]|uniref:paraquat-inducible protein A n=1 Tax=unclassified Pseudoalteromonas TaxID=194690 RepID=UPI000C0888F8|nr:MULTISPECIES: paraquat-inducible protein A [unclassified Pseudoalteromonas]MDP2635845.1 paraquat-inducible protein A [Pseudoalteromonas sp. 1_MG-2023]PHN88742.1 paraquat-inducible membrane protein A [Pseudoalteromonas sp. 3D05]